MKHLAIIQSKFLKEAAKWDDWTYEMQHRYLQMHPRSKLRITKEPKESKIPITEQAWIAKSKDRFHRIRTALGWSQSCTERLKKIKNDCRKIVMSNSTISKNKATRYMTELNKIKEDLQRTIDFVDDANKHLSTLHTFKDNLL